MVSFAALLSKSCRTTGQLRRKTKAEDGRSRCGTYNDGDGGSSAQDLLHKAISVVQGFHDLPLALSDLK